jgi:hypothetical protein
MDIRETSSLEKGVALAYILLEILNASGFQVNITPILRCIGSLTYQCLGMHRYLF